MTGWSVRSSHAAHAPGPPADESAMSSLSRRSFLRLGAGVAVAGAAPLWPGGVAAAATGRARGARLARATFQPAVGSTFLLDAGSWSTEAVLEEVGDLPSGPASGDEASFGLLFRAPASAPSEQATFRVHSARVGTFTLLAVPVDRGRIARYYQVIVNSGNVRRSRGERRV